MDILHSNPLSSSPQIVTKTKNGILQEAKNEERYLKNILKDLSHMEKVEHKAEKEASKAELAFASSKKREQVALRDVYKAENRRNAIVADIVQARNDLQDLTNANRVKHSAINKIETSLEDLKKQEQAALKDVYRAEHKHHVAVSSVEQARADFKESSREYNATRTVLERKTSYVDNVMAKHDQNTHTRNLKLTALRGPSGANEAGRVIPEVDASVIY